MKNMKKIVTITGHKHTNKHILAERLAGNSDIEYVKPYTAMELSKVEDPNWRETEFNIVLPNVLEDMMEKEKVLAVTEIGEQKYVFFEFQFRKPFSVIIVDDYAVVSIKDRWNGKMFTIRTVSDNEEQSDRVGEYLYKHEFDTVFDYKHSDYDELEYLIGDQYG